MLEKRQQRVQSLLRAYRFEGAVWDQIDDEPIRRYAHIHAGVPSWPISTTDTPEPHPGYAESGGWSLRLTVDLDTGLAVASSAGAGGWPVFEDEDA